MAELIPAGYYMGKPTGGRLTTTRGGTPQFAVTFALEGGENRTVFMFATDKAWQYTEEKLLALGWNNDPDDMRFTTESIELSCKHEEYQGKTNEKWDVANGKKEWEPAPDDVKRSVMARWKASAGKAKPKTAPKPVREAPTLEDDGDIPI